MKKIQFLKNKFCFIFIIVMTLLFSAFSIPTNAQILQIPENSMEGIFYNINANRGGNVSISSPSFDEELSGYMNFTQLPGDNGALCGAGELIGSVTGRNVDGYFISNDLDVGCGFDKNGIFHISGQVNDRHLHFSGNYQIENSGGSQMAESPGVFELWGNNELPRRITYSGDFTNTTHNRSGILAMDIAFGEATISGYMDFSNYPGTSALCGAGEFTGLRRNDNSLKFSFISYDQDEGCGFDHGNQFILDAVLSDDNLSIAGSYKVGGQSGVFDVSLDESITVPFLDLPFDYSDSTFYDQCQDTELDMTNGKLDSYFDHQYPTYNTTWNGEPINTCITCRPHDLHAVNFHGYDGSVSNPQPPYRVQYNGHDGIDFRLVEFTPVLAAASGEVIFAGDTGVPLGIVVRISHPNGYETEYAHLNSISEGIEKEPEVTRNIDQPIGYVGDTGDADGPHLHFVVRNPEGIAVDPFGWMPKRGSAFYGLEDPWQIWNDQNRDGLDATSHYLWIYELLSEAHLSNLFETILDSPSGNVTAIFPPYDSPLMIQISEDIFYPRIPRNRAIYSFSMYGFNLDNQAISALDSEITLMINLASYENLSRSGDDQSDPILYLWDEQEGVWGELITQWDPSTLSAHVSTIKFGNFALARPEKYEYEIYLPYLSR